MKAICKNQIYREEQQTMKIRKVTKNLVYFTCMDIPSVQKEECVLAKDLFIARIRDNTFTLAI